jgi:outer membrane protein assembly factor BamB
MRLLTLAVLFFLAQQGHSGDWPQWAGPTRNWQAASDEKPLNKLPAEAKVLWRKKAGHGFSSPVVSRGTVIFMDNQNEKEVVTAFSTADGTKLWSHELDDTFKDAQGPPGPRATPVIHQDVVFVTSCRGEFRCLDLKTGAVRWRTNFEKDFGAVFIGEKGKTPGARRHGNTAAPIVLDGYVYVAPGGTNNSSVAALDIKTGQKRWSAGNYEAGYAGLVIGQLAAKPQLIAFHASGIAGFDLSADEGKELWNFPIETAFGRHAATPLVTENLVLVSSHQAGFIGIRPQPHGATNELTTVWTNKEAALNFSSPILAGKSVIGLGSRKNVYSLDATSGEFRWNNTASGLFTSSPDKAFASFLSIGNKVLISTDGGVVALIDPNASQYTELGRLQVCGANWCHPAYSNGKLFIRDSRELLVLQLAE